MAIPKKVLLVLVLVVIALAGIGLLALAAPAPPGLGVTGVDEPVQGRDRPALEVDGNLVRHPVWGVQLEIPGYTPWGDHPMGSQANFVLAAQTSGRCSLNLSMFVERVGDGTAADECRRGYVGNPVALAKRRNVRLQEHQASPFAYTLFDILLGDSGPPGRMVNNQAYGYWTRDDHCFELHLSAINCDGFAEQAMPILRSVKISEDTGATLETVDLAGARGGDPRNWHLHLVTASHYLHGAKPNNPERARRFYLSALKLGGADIPPEEHWLMEEGIGLSWLMQDDGRQALTPLLRALELARTLDARGKTVRETLHNLACAHTLAGDLDAACARLREFLPGLDDKDLESEVKDIRKDRQLKTLRKSDCYRTLLKELGRG